MIQYGTHSRRRRSVEEKHAKVDDRNELKVKFQALGKNFDILLKRNRRLFSPHFKVEVLGKHGSLKLAHDMEKCHYRGEVTNHNKSHVSLSNCNGLVSTNYSDPILKIFNGYHGIIRQMSLSAYVFKNLL